MLTSSALILAGSGKFLMESRNLTPSLVQVSGEITSRLPVDINGYLYSIFSFHKCND
jgi:hypothetical protein